MAEAASLELPSNMTIASVEALHETMEPLVLEHQDVVVKASEVERIDTAGLQLLLAFQQEITKHDLSVEWQEPSEALLEAATLIGLQKTLGLDSANSKG